MQHPPCDHIDTKSALQSQDVFHIHKFCCPEIVGRGLTGFRYSAVVTPALQMSHYVNVLALVITLLGGICPVTAGTRMSGMLA